MHLCAKKRDYRSGGLGSSKQEKFAQLWRSRNDPDAAAPPAESPSDLSAWEQEIKRAEAADALVPDANWRLRGAAAGGDAGAMTSGSATSGAAVSVASGRAVASDAWKVLVAADGGTYAAADAWAAVEAQAAAGLVVVVGADAGGGDAVKQLHDKLPRKAGFIVVVAAGDAASTAKRFKKKYGTKVAAVYDPSRTFAASCGASDGVARVLVLAPPHPSPDAHTIVSKFPGDAAAAASLPDAIISALTEKGLLRRR